MNAHSQLGEFCQYTFPYGSFGCNDNYWIIDTANNPNCIWQFGYTEKPFFNHQDPCLATDTLNSYPANNYSSISLVVTTTRLANYVVDRIEIYITHSMDTDTLKDGGYIEYSPDNGSTWLNLCENYGNQLVSPLYNGQTGFSGNHPLFENIYFNFTPSILTDTVLLRVVFISDSVSSNKSGWQIGNIILFMWAESTIGNNIKYFSEETFPTQLYVGKEYNISNININDISIYDLTGRKINCVNIINENTFMIDGNITEGIYIIDFKNQSLIKNRKALILNNGF